MEFDLTKMAKKALQNVINNTLYRGKPINDWINFIANNADDLISRQEAIDFIKDHSYPVRYDSNSIEQGMTITGIEQALNEVPTVQSEIIRCKDCKYRDADDFCTGRGCPNGLVPDDGFCDKGERRHGCLSIM